MAVFKEVAAITFVAGLMAAGATATLPIRSSQTVETAASGRTSGNAPTPGEVTDANKRLREGLSANYGQPQASTMLSPDVPAAAAVPPPVPEVQKQAAMSAAASVAMQPERPPPAAPLQETRISPKAPDPSWTSKPRPELVAKADALFDVGDIAGARLWLGMADEEGDADATFKLAETYDPDVLREWRVIGIVSDVAKARALYERARNGGVGAAQERVARLAQ